MLFCQKKKDFSKEYLDNENGEEKMKMNIKKISRIICCLPSSSNIYGHLEFINITMAGRTGCVCLPSSSR